MTVQTKIKLVRKTKQSWHLTKGVTPTSLYETSITDINLEESNGFHFMPKVRQKTSSSTKAIMNQSLGGGGFLSMDAHDRKARVAFKLSDK